jgi:hypothetical protein
MPLHDLLSPAWQFPLRRAALSLRGQLQRARLWRWEVVSFSRRTGVPCKVLYAGTEDRRWLAATILGLDRLEGSAPLEAAFAADTALVSEAPLPGALRIPRSVHAVVPLGRSIDDIIGTYDVELRRRLRKQRARYRLRQVLDEEEIAHLNATMLEPYAAERHGAHVQHLRLAAVRATARGLGRLDLLLDGDRPVGCHLGYPLTVGAHRHWVNWRLGYPRPVFSDPRQLREVNSMNVHLAMEWAVANGYHHYDLGGCVARPADGLLQWKRRRGGALDPLHNDGWFFLRLPRQGSAGFLWEAPVFAMERQGITLCLGLPPAISDGEAMKRFREMGFAGLVKVRLHCGRPAGEPLLGSLRAVFSRQARPPALELVAGS